MINWYACPRQYSPGALRVVTSMNIEQIAPVQMADFTDTGHSEVLKWYEMNGS